MVNRLILVAKISGRALVSLSRGIAALPSLLFGMVVLFVLASVACWYLGFNSSDFVATWIHQELFDNSQDKSSSLVDELEQLLLGSNFIASSDQSISDLTDVAANQGIAWNGAYGSDQQATNQPLAESETLFDQDLAAAIELNRQALAAKAKTAPAATPVGTASENAAQEGVSSDLKQRFAFLDAESTPANTNNVDSNSTTPQPTQDTSLQLASSPTALDQQISQGLAQVSRLNGNSAGAQALKALNPDFMEVPQGRITNLIVTYQDEEEMSWLGLGRKYSAYTKEFVAPTCSELMQSDGLIMTYHQAEIQLKLIKEHLCSKGVCEQAYADNPALYDKLLKQAFRLWFDAYYPQKKKALASRQHLNNVEQNFLPDNQSLTRENAPALTELRQENLAEQGAESGFLALTPDSSQQVSRLGNYLQVQFQGSFNSGMYGSMSVESLQQPSDQSAVLATGDMYTMPVSDQEVPQSWAVDFEPQPTPDQKSMVAQSSTQASGNPWNTVSDYGAGEQGFQILGSAEIQRDGAGTAAEHARADVQGRHALGASQDQTSLSQIDQSHTDQSKTGGGAGAQNAHASAVDLRKMDTILWPFAPSAPFKRSSLGIGVGGAPTSAPAVDPNQKIKSTIRTDWDS